MGDDAVTVGELAEAMKARGLRIVRGDGGLTVSHPSRAGIRYLEEEITVKDGLAYWSWGPVINGATLDDVAALIDAIVSLPASSQMYNSAG